VEKVAETLVPGQITPVAGLGVKVGAVGSAVTLTKKFKMVAVFPLGKSTPTLYMIQPN
jgi:hypothetical protein